MRGVTLVELLVVIAVLGVLTAVSTLAVTSLRPTAESERIRLLTRARATAIRAGRAVTISSPMGEMIRFLPDGRALGGGVDPLTGEALDARH